MLISLATWPSRSLSSKCFFRARLDDSYDPVIFLSLGVFSFGTMQSRFVFFYRHVLGLLHNSIVLP